MSNLAYPSFPKIPRFNREVIVTEKIDGTNSQILIEELTGQTIPDGASVVDVTVSEDNPTAYAIRAGSRNRWLTPEADNFGFARWVQENADELVKLGPGSHFGEWYGSGIQRGYGLPKGEKRFMLFNTARWSDPESRPAITEVATVLFQGNMADLVGYEGGESHHLDYLLHKLRTEGSQHIKGFLNPEGVVLFHVAAHQLFKILLEGDEVPKGSARDGDDTPKGLQ